MHKQFPVKLLHAMEFSVLVLLLVEAYLKYKDEIDESIARLKTILTEKGDNPDGQQQSAEN